MFQHLKNIVINNIRAVIITIVALLGVATLLVTNAAANLFSFEAEQSNLAGVTLISDTSASDGAAIQFGSIEDVSKKCSELQNLKFCDDFDGAAGTYPDNSKWNVFTSGSSWGSQCWKKTPENISLDGQGNLKQTIIDTGSVQCNSSWAGVDSPFTSGGMDTKSRFTTKYGKFEIRAKLSCADSVWGSIWLSTGTGPGWPRSGEIDIWERGYNEYWRTQQTVWVPKQSNSSQAVSSTFFADLPTNQRWCDDFHVYGLIWRENSLQFTVDGNVTGELTPEKLAAQRPDSSWPFNSYDLRLLIDHQYGWYGRWTGDPKPSQLPTTMLIDYVRVFDIDPSDPNTGGDTPIQPGDMLDIPINVTTNSNNRSVTLDWDDVEGADSYTVRWGTGGAWTNYSNDQGNSNNPTSSNFTVTGLTNGTTYNFAIAARDTTGTYVKGSYSSSVTATPN